MGKPPTIVSADTDEPKPTKVQKTASDMMAGSNSATNKLVSVINRIEKLEEERAAIGADVKDIYAEAKSAGFDPKVLRMLIRIRRIDPADQEEMETLLDVYRHALGM